MNVQLLFLSGNAVDDCKQFKTKTDKVFATFRLAVNEYNKTTKESKAYYYEVIVFGKTAEKAIEMIKKGDFIIVQGRPEADAYISNKDKEAKANIKVIASSWQALK